MAVDTPAIKDLVNDQEVFFYQADNDHDLAQQIKMVLANQDLATQKVEQAYQKVKSYSWEIRAEKIIEFIKQQLALS